MAFSKITHSIVTFSIINDEHYMRYDMKHCDIKHSGIKDSDNQNNKKATLSIIPLCFCLC
jgi:hypothetical protein